MTILVETSVQKPVVMGSGLIALDIVLSEAMPARRWAGGSCGNILTILSYFGWKSFPVSRLAADAAGQLVRQDLAQWGVQPDFIDLTPTRATPVIIEKIKQTSHGIKHSFSWRCPSCGAHLPGFSPITSLASSDVTSHAVNPDVFFFDRISRGILNLAIESAQRGALIVFEPSGINDPRLFKEALSIAHIIKYSHERLRDAGDLLNPINAPNALLQVETLGGDGLRFQSSYAKFKTKGWQLRPAFEVKQLKDSAGAGDWCTAGLLHGLARGGRTGFMKATQEQLEQSIQLGQALAAWTCTFEGARGGMYNGDKNALDSELKIILSHHGSVLRQQKLVTLSSERDIAALICSACDYPTKTPLKRPKRSQSVR